MKNKISKERINKLVRASGLNEKEVLKEIQNEEKRTVAKITDQDIYNNLESWYKASTRTNRKDGKNWYKDAQTFCKDTSKKYKIDSYIVASVVSALSPNNKWKRNKIDAEALIGCYTSGKFTEKEIMKDVKVCTYDANKLKAWKILTQGKKISSKSPKTHAFAMNVGLLSSDHITVDKHHLRACVCVPTDGVVNAVENCTSLQYRRVEAITAKLAKRYRLKGFQMQAIIWVAIKQNWNR